MNRKVIYLSSPLSGKTESDVDRNIAFVKRAARFAIKQGVMPYIPHLTLPTILNDKDPEERALGISLDLDLLERCDELWMFVENGISSGMKTEQEAAERFGIPITVIYDLTAAEDNETNPSMAERDLLNDLRFTMAREEQDSAIEELWDEFQNIPFENNAPNTGSTKLAEDWRWFRKGTARRDIQNWFGSRHSGGMLHLMQRDLLYAEEGTIYRLRELECDCTNTACIHNRDGCCAFGKVNDRPAHQTYADGCLDKAYPLDSIPS